MQTRNCCVGQNGASGHAGHFEPFHPCNYSTPRLISSKTQSRYCFPGDFEGPCKDFNPPGNREPAVGERDWGDVPYLPSYRNEYYQADMKPSRHVDNLYTRGPFFKGVSESHEEFVNHGGIEPKKYHKYVRHYEEPGMKSHKSMTQTDFGPPYPTVATENKPYCEQPLLGPVRSKPNNIHIKEVEYKSVDPEIVFIERVPKMNYSTENGDNYIFYQKAEMGNKWKGYKPPENERFQDHVRKSHSECPYEIPFNLMNAPIRCVPKVNQSIKDNNASCLQCPEKEYRQSVTLTKKCACK